MRRWWLLTLWLLASPSAPGLAADEYKAEAIGALTDTTVAEPIRSALQPQGARLSDGKGRAVAELWLRRAVPLKAGASGPAYGSLAEGTLVGVVRYASAGSDFRGQPIKPGIYTLRYIQIPADGNHTGAAPSSDFVALVPAGADQDLGAQPKFDDLVKGSRQASGTNHPAVLMLTPAAASGTLPAVQHQEGLWGLSLRTQVQGAKDAAFPVALILVGKAEG